MIIDDVIWEIINNGQCAYKTKTETNVFCSDPNNVTGLCNRNSCPLANSRYATIFEDKGICYLKIKTAERAHTPNELWEIIKLDPSYNKALEQIDSTLQYWPNFLKHKCKQRFTRIRQVLVKKKKMKLEGSEEYEVISRKAEKREKRRLVKAEKSAVIENHISEELLKNLKNGKYNQIYNYPNKVLDHLIEKEHVVDMDKDEYYDEADFDHGYIEDFSDEEGEGDEVGDEEGDQAEEEDDENYDDIFNTSNNKTRDTGSLKPNNKKYQNKKRKRKGIEYEYENEYDENPNKQKNINNQTDY